MFTMNMFQFIVLNMQLSYNNYMYKTIIYNRVPNFNEINYMYILKRNILNIFSLIIKC